MNFTQPVSMKVDKEQFDYLKGELEKRGYKLTDYTGIKKECEYIATNLAGNDSLFSNLYLTYTNDYNRHFIDHYNPELFLALASMTDEKYGIGGEWWMFTGEGYEYNFTHGRLYKSIYSINTAQSFVDNIGDRNGFHPNNLNYFHKATVEELINHFSSNAKNGVDFSKMLDNCFSLEGYDLKEVDGNLTLTYQVKQSDLTGQIEGFPIEVVQKMVERQVEQGNKSDVSVFQRYKNDGFTWIKTVEGNAFWNGVIMKENFNLFFQKYPKESSDNSQITHKVTRSQMAEIHSIACKEWKKIIEKIVEKYFGAFANEADLPDEEVKAMFDAATDSQLPVLKRVFPNYGKMVIEKDTPVLCSDAGIFWGIRYYSHGHSSFQGSEKSDCAKGLTSWKYIVPVTDFDFNDLECNVKKSIV